MKFHELEKCLRDVLAPHWFNSIYPGTKARDEMGAFTRSIAAISSEVNQIFDGGKG